ncbi:sensor histidine kinase [Streptomyces sp. Li-HN-5-11]|nr:sensor histidine kinase [Streptomyces sp. Li-HN-5-11]WNM29112.1 sensor histidine kinase [Streptomyces sp. Li-HN-5-11]
MLRRLRTTLGEHPSPLSPPLSKYRWLRVATYLAVAWIACFVTLVGHSGLTSHYRISGALALLAGLAQGVAVVLALWRPVPAWALSLLAVVSVAFMETALVPNPSLLVTPSAVPVPRPGPGPVPMVPMVPDWPWNGTQILAHATVIFLLALRVPTRWAIAALTASGPATFVVVGVIDGDHRSGNCLVAAGYFTVAVLVGSALRGRREARIQLAEQATITAEERARRTLLEERSRIARELHDVVAHHMSVISIQAQVAPYLTENPSEELKENLAGIRQNALEALAELRRVLGVLRSENRGDPYGLGESGSGAAPRTPQPTLDRLDALVENTRAAGLTVTMDVRDERSGTAPYPPGVELSAYRIVQEALSNALRHAPGSTVRVEVTHVADGVYLSVANSRPQRPVPPSPGAGHGLLGMRERATMLGGHVTAARTLHGGFAVSAFLPRDGTTPFTAPVPPDASVLPPITYTDPADTPVVHLEPPAAPAVHEDAHAPGPPRPTGDLP